jgi:hypothetical protein
MIIHYFYLFFDFGELLIFLEYNKTFRGFTRFHSDLGPNENCIFRKLTIIVHLLHEKS